MSIYIEAKDLRSSTTDMKVSSFTSKMVYGQDVSIMESTRPSGYHSKPHYHTAEQFNICMKGELYFYTDKAAYKLKPGDIIRIPPNVMHWACNKSSEPCTQMTIHAPSFQNCCDSAVGLFDEGEEVPPGNDVENLYKPDDPDMIARVEGMRAIGEDR